MRNRLKVNTGINDYPGTGQDLRGCVNDALDWDKLLTAEGYVGPVLLNEQATWANVVAAIEDVVSRARFGDRIVLTFSCHGSKVPDKDGDEADGWDECLVLHDFRAGGLLLDDELNAMLAKRRFGVRVYIFSDTCHSGTLHRFAGLDPHSDQQVETIQPRYLPPVEFLNDEQLVRAAVLEEKGIRAEGKPRPTAALISGCADAEYSYDAWIDGRPRGAFTAAATRTWFSGQTLRHWHQQIRTILPSGSYPQSPQLQATNSQKRWAL